jgi:hypothetical protein
MPLGPGKYDDLATYVREHTQAEGVVVVVFGGTKGGGFSVQAPLPLQVVLPALLRMLADDIDASVHALSPNTKGH